MNLRLYCMDLIIIIIFSMLAILESFIVLKIENARININYGFLALIRILSALIVSWNHCNSYSDKFLFSGILILGYWMVREPAFNYWMGVPWDYIETTENEDKDLSEDGQTYFATKVAMLLVISTIYFLA